MRNELLFDEKRIVIRQVLLQRGPEDTFYRIRLFPAIDVQILTYLVVCRDFTWYVSYTILSTTIVQQWF